MAKERQVSSASAKLVDLGASLLSSHLPRSLFGPSAGAAAAANASIPTTGSTNIVPFSALITSLASLVAAGVVASLSPLWAAFGEMSFAEWGTVVLPPLAYWLYSGFLYYIPPLFPSFTEKYRLHPTTERINRVSPGEVVRTVIVQHLIQMTVALIVAVLTRGQGSPDSWPVIGLKLAVGAFILDGYEYWIHRWVGTAVDKPDFSGHFGLKIIVKLTNNFLSTYYSRLPLALLAVAGCTPTRTCTAPSTLSTTASPPTTPLAPSTTTLSKASSSTPSAVVLLLSSRL